MACVGEVCQKSVFIIPHYRDASEKIGLKDKVCLVTGSTSGIGKATALGLARLGATVIVVARDESRGQETLEYINKESNGPPGHLFIADLSEIDSIKNLCKEFKNQFERLDVLINNAGVVTQHGKNTTDGIDTLFAVNYIAPFLLTNLLLDLLKSSAPSRIINVSSSAHGYGNIDFNDVQSRKKGAWRAYGDSKLALLLFSYELAKRLEGTGVTVNALHPGVISTNLISGRESSLSRGFLRAISSPFLRSPQKGAEPSVYLASSPEVEGITGKYFDKLREQKSSERSYDEEAGKKLWQVGADLTAMK